MNNKTAVIFQVEGLGVPVQMPSNRNADGYEVRWSSDPDVPLNAPVHALIGEKSLQRFLSLSIDKRFRDANLISLVPVKLSSQHLALWQSNPTITAVGIAPDEAIRSGVSPSAWEYVRVALVVSGTTPQGPRMDEIEWYGTREEHNEGMHLREAYEHCKAHRISAPTIFHHNHSEEVFNASDFFSAFQRQLKPSLRAAHEMSEALEQYLLKLDVDKIAPERALKYLEDLQKATAKKVEQRNLDKADLQRSNQRGIRAVDTEQIRSTPHTPASEPSETVRPSRGPRLH